MKISVSLEAEDVAFLDHYASRHDKGSRSAAVAAAIRSLRDEELEDAYSEAFIAWRDSGEGRVWESVVADGLDDRDAVVRLPGDD